MEHDKQTEQAIELRETMWELGQLSENSRSTAREEHPLHDSLATAYENGLLRAGIGRAHRRLEALLAEMNPDVAGKLLQHRLARQADRCILDQDDQPAGDAPHPWGDLDRINLD